MKGMTLCILVLTLAFGALAEEYDCGWFCGSPDFDEIDNTEKISETDGFVGIPYYASCDVEECCGDVNCNISASTKTVIGGSFSATYSAGVTMEFPTGVGVNASSQVTVNGEATSEVIIQAGVAASPAHCEQCEGQVGPGYRTKIKTYKANVTCTYLGAVCRTASNVDIEERLTYRFSDYHQKITCGAWSGCDACVNPSSPDCPPPCP